MLTGFQPFGKLRTQLRDTLVSQFNRQCPHPSYLDVRQLGRAIEWRTELLDYLPVTRSTHNPFDTLRTQPFPAFVQRQIEDELDRYQREITTLSDELQVGDIDAEEFDHRLRNLTIAILLLAFLRGSQITDSEMTDRALATLRSGGETGIQVDYANIPPEAADELREEIRVSIEAAENLGVSILAGRYEDRRGSLASRLALWATTALGVYSLGVLFREGDPFLEWIRNPFKDSCVDCIRLDGQIHTKSEWKISGWRPQARHLTCRGYNCGCSWHETQGPSVGGF